MNISILDGNSWDRQKQLLGLTLSSKEGTREISFAGKPGLKRVGYFGENGSSYGFVLILDNNGKVYKIQAYQKTEDKTDFTSSIDQILSTFKFLDQNTPEIVTQAFYDWYLSCLDKHFTDNTGKSPNEDCPSQTNPNVDSQLQKNLGQPKDSDLVLCAQNTPRSIKVDKGYITGNKATVVVHTFFDRSGDNPLNVDLQLIDNKWKITNISCTHS